MSLSHQTQTLTGWPTRLLIFYLCLSGVIVAGYGWRWRGAMVRYWDSEGYFEVAQDLADFRLDQLHDRSPGYPLLLLLTGAQQQATQRLLLAGLLLHVAAIWLLAVLLNTLGFSAGLIMLFGLLLGLPPYVQSAGLLLTENLAGICLVGGVAGLAAWFRRRRTVYLSAAALAIAYGGLTRPTYQALAPACVLLILLLAALTKWLSWREAGQASAWLLLLSGLLVGGYAGINYARFGYFGITPLLGYNLSTRTVRVWERLPNEFSAVREVLVKTRDAELVKPGSSHTGFQSIWEARAEIARVTGLSPVEEARYLLRLNLVLIRQNPLNYLQQVGESLGGSYWFPASNRLSNVGSKWLQLLWAVLHFSIVGVFAGAFVLLLGVAAEQLRQARTSKPLSETISLQVFIYCLTGLIVGYTMIISCMVDVGNARQRLPTDALILLLAFLGPKLWWQLVSPTPAAPPAAPATAN